MSNTALVFGPFTSREGALAWAGMLSQIGRLSHIEYRVREGEHGVSGKPEWELEARGIDDCAITTENARFIDETLRHPAVILLMGDALEAQAAQIRHRQTLLDIINYCEDDLAA